MIRLDMLLVERGIAKSREQAQALVLAGEVWSGERRLEKPGLKVGEDLEIQIRGRALPFVSRGGEKLKHALEVFSIPVTGRVCLDIGASTGGFTDCLLQAGAQHVFAVDVGYGQLDSKLRSDPRVSVLERTNARYLTLQSLIQLSPAASRLDLAVVDVSFISLAKVLPPVAKAIPSIKEWVVLFKPQFEVGKEHVLKGGRARTGDTITHALTSLDEQLSIQGFRRKAGPESSPLPGKKSGNVESLLLYEYTAP